MEDVADEHVEDGDDEHPEPLEGQQRRQQVAHQHQAAPPRAASESGVRVSV